jgi:hypothetical protein
MNKGSRDKCSCAEKLDNDSEAGKLKLYTFKIDKTYTDQTKKKKKKTNPKH